MLKGATEEYKK